jgi:hypothetical protein
MKVFVLYYMGRGDDNDKVIDIFSTREKAEKRIKQYTAWDRPYLYIEEEVVL